MRAAGCPVIATGSSGQGSWVQYLATAVSLSTTLLPPAQVISHLYTDRTLLSKETFCYIVICVFRISVCLKFVMNWCTCSAEQLP